MPKRKKITVPSVQRPADPIPLLLHCPAGPITLSREADLKRLVGRVWREGGQVQGDHLLWEKEPRPRDSQAPPQPNQPSSLLKLRAVRERVSKEGEETSQGNGWGASMGRGGGIGSFL